MKYILNFGGGVNSTALFFLLTANKYKLDEVIFADTGAELPSTYATVEKMKAECVRREILFTILASVHGNIYDYYFKKHAIPSILRRDCTFKFKIRTVRNYLRAKYGKKEIFTQYIGISYEELTRMKKSDVKYTICSYPLIDHQINREDCITINKSFGFDKVEKSGCWFCPFQKKQVWIDLMNNYPDLFEKAVHLEENCPNKKVGLAAKPLRLLREYKGQTKLESPEPTCEVSGGCFL